MNANTNTPKTAAYTVEPFELSGPWAGEAVREALYCDGDLKAYGTGSGELEALAEKLNAAAPQPEATSTEAASLEPTNAQLRVYIDEFVTAGNTSMEGMLRGAIKRFAAQAPTAVQASARYLLVAMGDDHCGYYTFCQDQDALRATLVSHLYCFGPGDGPDDEQNESIDANLEELLENGSLSFEGDPGIHLYKLPDGKSVVALATAAVQASTEAKDDLCPNCNGSGSVEVLSDNSPDAYDVTVDCPHCGGTGALLDAYKGVSQLLKTEKRKFLTTYAELLLAKMEASSLATGAVQPKGATALNRETQDQIAAVMLRTGTPEQQAEALRYCGIDSAAVQGDASSVLPVVAIEGFEITVIAARLRRCFRAAGVSYPEPWHTDDKTMILGCGTLLGTLAGKLETPPTDQEVAQAAISVNDPIAWGRLGEKQAEMLRSFAHALCSIRRTEELKALTAFHKFFQHRCEMLFGTFGMEVIDVYNRAAALTTSAPAAPGPAASSAVPASVVAGALFDFMGRLTSGETRYRFSAYDEAGPAVEALKEFMALRDIECDPNVTGWRAQLAAAASPALAPEQSHD